MMIIIFINELKNISLSLFKIYYIKDIADINIKKYCNDIYCEAETARFKLADNSYSLISPNDIFNTKTYYYMILILVILIYGNLFYKFLEYNNEFYPLINNIDGDIIVYFIKFLPYLLAFITFAFIIIIIIARYIPYDKQGYINYFNYNNNYINEINSFNIDKIHLYVLLSILVTSIIYILLSIQFAEILNYPDEDYVRGKKYKYLCIGYIVIVAMFTYLILNLFNIILSFSENNYPKLDDNIIESILNNLDNKITELNKKYNTLEIIKECYEPAYITNEASVDENNIYTIDNINYYVGATLKTLIKVPTPTPTIEQTTTIEKDKLKREKSSLDFIGNKVKYTLYYNMIKDNDKPPLDNIPNTILNYLKLTDFTIETYKTFNNKISNANTTLDNKKLLLKILILFTINEIKNFKKTIQNLNLKDITNDDKYNYYDKHLKLLEIANYNNKLILSFTFDIEHINKLEEYIKKYISYNKKTTDAYEINFGIEYEPFSTNKEAKDNYSADLSYNNENTFYENYFNVLEKLQNKGYFDLEYNVGSYYIKNIKTLLYFILIIFGVGILCIILFYIPNLELIYKYSGEIILPIVLLLIFVIYIALFINFNTNYNSNVIYGVLNSSYKRDLNDLNNMLIPVIHNAKENENNYFGFEQNNYLELYIISNVFMSFIHNSNNILGDYQIILKDKIIEEKEERINYKEKIDFINFQKDYDYLGKLIYEIHYKNDMYMVKDNEINTYLKLHYNLKDPTDTNIKKLFTKKNVGETEDTDNDKKSDILISYIKDFVISNIKEIKEIEPSIKQYIYDDSEEINIKHIKHDLRNFLIIVIKNLIKYFKNYDIKKKLIDNIDNNNFFKDNVYFYKDKYNNVIWNKFILKKDFFDNINKELSDKSIYYSKYPKIFINNDIQEKELIIVDNCVNQFLKILSHYYFNRKIIEEITDITTIADKFLKKECDNCTNIQLHVNNYRNKKLFKLLLLTKPTNISPTIDIDMDDTFKIKDTDNSNKIIEQIKKKVDGKVKITGDSLIQVLPVLKDLKPFQLNYIFQYMVKTNLKKNKEDTRNYLMNIIKTIYYQLNEEKIEYHTPQGLEKDEYYINKDIINQLDTTSEEKIYDNAKYTITYELFNTYFLNLIIIVFIYNIAMLNNKNILIH